MQERCLANAQNAGVAERRSYSASARGGALPSWPRARHAVGGEERLSPRDQGKDPLAARRREEVDPRELLELSGGAAELGREPRSRRAVLLRRPDERAELAGERVVIRITQLVEALGGRRGVEAVDRDRVRDLRLAAHRADLA